MAIVPSLATFVDWTKFVPLLGIELCTTLLPCQVSCPLRPCAGNLQLMTDHATGGIWAYCNTCKFAGDMIELAAAYWTGLDIQTTVRKLLSLGINLPEERVFPSVINHYIEQHIDKRKRFWDLWQKGRNRLLVDDSNILRALQHKLGIRMTMDRDRWLTGPGLFLGGATKHDIETCFMPGAMKYTAAGSLQNPGQSRVFIGPGWIEMLMFPMFDLPGRVKGFMFIGREAKETDTAFSAARYNTVTVRDNISHIRRYRDADTGLALYDALKYAQNQVFVMNDPILATRMQCWHMQDYGTPAPVVSTYTNPCFSTDPAIWEQITQQPLFWGRPTGAMFRHAKVTNARVCLSGFEFTGASRTFTRTPLQEWLYRVEKEARPWDEVLEKLLHELPTGDAETLLLQMSLSPDELKQFVMQCPEPLRLRIEPCCTHTRARSVIESGQTVVESNGWYLTSTNEQLCNGILRIDKVIYHERTDKRYYAGRILFQGHEVAFYEPAEIVETGTFQWMRKRLMKAGLGYLNFSLAWESRAIWLATTFHQPTVCKGFNTIGWDVARACFVFPSFIISSKGEVTDNTDIEIIKRRAPALMLEKPVPLTAEDIAMLPNGEGASVFWAVAACIASNILAPVFGVPTTGIGLVGVCAETTGRVAAKLLGCAEQSVTRRIEQVETFDDMCAEHGWPLLFKPAKTPFDEWITWLAEHNKKNCIVPLEWRTAKILAMHPGWHIIEAGHYVASVAVCDTAAKVIPSFLKFVADQKFKLPAVKGKGFAHTVLTWLAHWFASLGGNHRIVISAARITNFDGDVRRQANAADAFIDLLCRLFDDGDITLERAGFITAGKNICALICFPGQNGSLGQIFIPKAVVKKVLITHGTPPLDHDNVSRILSDTNLATTHTYAGLSGWLLNEAVWNKRLAAWRSWQRYKLRVE